MYVAYCTPNGNGGSVSPLAQLKTNTKFIPVVGSSTTVSPRGIVVEPVCDPGAQVEELYWLLIAKPEEKE